MNREVSITSSQNPKLKKAIRLHDSRGRRQQGRIILFGKAEILRAQQSGLAITELFTCADLLDDRKLIERLQPKEHFSLTKELFQKLAFGQRGDGLVAIGDRPNTEFSNFNLETTSLIVVLESIEKPGNLGAVFRSAAAAGVDGIILVDAVTDIFHPNSIRSSLGNVFTIPNCCVEGEMCKARLVESGFQLVATRVDGKQSYTDADLSVKTAIVLGSEAEGLSEIWTGPDVHPVTIPMTANVDSLNIAMTSTLMVFEARRQRR